MRHAIVILFVAFTAWTLGDAQQSPGSTAASAPAAGRSARTAQGAANPSPTGSSAKKEDKPQNAGTDKKPEVPLSERARAIMEHTTWVFPMFKTAESQAKVITQIDHFPYTEQLYTPSYTIQAHPQSQDTFASPEQAMISRISDMMNADYKAWLEAWDPESRAMTTELEQEHNITPESQLAVWKSTFSKTRLTLARRVQTGPYVIVTYYVTSNGQAVLPTEFPAVFHQLDSRWYATQDLTSDPFPAISPWIKSETRKELDVRPLQQEQAAPAEKQVTR